MNGNVGQALRSIRHLLGTRSMLQSGRRVCTAIAPLAVQVEIFGATGIFLRREAFFNAHPCNETDVLRIQYVSNIQAGAGIIRMSCAGVMGKQAIPMLSIHSTAMDISALMM